MILSLSRNVASIPLPCQCFGSGARRDDGFIAIDALVGLGIFAVSLGLTLQVVSLTKTITGRAAEYRQASTLGRGLVSEPNLDLISGVSGGLNWRVSTDASSKATLARGLCRRDAELVGVQSHRRYTFSAVRFCDRALVREAG